MGESAGAVLVIVASADILDQGVTLDDYCLRRLKSEIKLRKVVEAGLGELWSPTQISKIFIANYPNDSIKPVAFDIDQAGRRRRRLT